MSLSRRVACSVVLLALAATSAGARPHVRPKPAKIEPIVAVAEPLAAQAAMDVLKRGGTAADAAVAVQAMLALIEPQSSSLSGGSFMLWYDAKTGTVSDYNGREVAPMGAAPEMFLKPDGTPMAFSEAVVSGRATGVPGAMFMLDQAQKDHGKLPWNTLFDAAIAQADNGFVITPRLGNYLQTLDFPEKHTPDTIAYFGDGHGGFKKPGDVIVNTAYATTLRAFAAHRSDVLRSGPIAEDIVARTHQDPLPGTMTLADLQNYRVQVTTAPVYATTRTFVDKPLCAPYHVYIVCTTSTPSGGPALLQGLRIAEHLPFRQWGVNDPRAWQALIETERLMYADRDRYEGDTPLFRTQLDAYLNSNYAMSRAALFKPGVVNPTPQPGNLPVTAAAPAADNTLEPGGTTHFVIRDTYGNVLSMTTTVESILGTGRMVDGFFLNNQLTDFSFSPKTPQGQDIANAVAPGKHPRSSMSPVIVFDATGKKVVVGVGSPGGTSIPAYNLKTLIAVLDWNLTMQQAIDLPNVVARGESIRIEQQRMDPALWDALTKMGYKLTPLTGEESGINGILRQRDGSFDGGADPRREGVVVKGFSPSSSEAVGQTTRSSSEAVAQR